ncbi:small conductance mechanosensitive ion channel family [Dorcoceras hygrometricum]|uniref:Small conductance mechanosensitive ion channel family n=1 Tax=Dorcoceras hygrometricum TaxID=472368 RepID=A0A2Z7CYM0_9LAMI|nr:small conductance mechanosensitive ion channel family [Dorcoceras hygrometricum]
MATRAWLRPVSRGNRHFTVGGGRLRQSGPRPEWRLLRQPALEDLTRSARTDSPRQVGRNNFQRERRRRRRLLREERGRLLELLGLGFDIVYVMKLKSTLSRLNDGLGPAQRARVNVHPHHRDFIVTPIVDQIGPIDSIFKTEYYYLKNHFSEPQCKMTVFPLNSGKSRFDPC